MNPDYLPEKHFNVTTAGIGALTPGNATFSNGNTVTFNCPSGLRIRDGTEIAIRNLALVYSWQNLTAALNNNSFSYISNSVSYPVVIPNGFYTYPQFNALLQQVMVEQGQYLISPSGVNTFFINMTYDTIYSSLVIELDVVPTQLATGTYANYTNGGSLALTGTTMQIVFPASNLGIYTGFPISGGTYPATPQSVIQYYQSINPPLESNVSSVQVTCNVANNSGISSVPNSILSFVPNTGYEQVIGSNGNVCPLIPMFYPTAANNYNQLVFTFIDQLGNNLVITDPSNILLVISFRTLKNPELTRLNKL